MKGLLLWTKLFGAMIVYYYHDIKKKKSGLVGYGGPNMGCDV